MSCLITAARSRLVGGLDRAPLRAEGRVLGVGLELRELVEVDRPAVADGRGDERRQARVAQRQPAPLGDAVGLVVEAVRPQLVEVAEQPLLEQVAVQRGHAVDRERADDRQVGHAHVRLRAVLDDRHARQARGVARPLVGDRAHEARVDLVDDVEQARQQRA